MASEESIAAALLAITSEKVSIRAAAKRHGVPRSTLALRYHNGNCGRTEAQEPSMKLNLFQEECLVKWIWMEDSCGRAPRHEDVRQMAQTFIDLSVTPLNFDRRDNEIGLKWVTRFLARHPEVSSMKGRKLEAIRRKGTTHQIVADFFQVYQNMYEKYNFQHEDIWNMDETGLGIGVTTNRTVIAPSYKRRTFVQSPENHDHVTIFECVSAAGKSIMPLVIFKGKVTMSDYYPVNTEHWSFHTTKNGWTDTTTALE